MKNINVFLTIGWIYPDLMSTYGDRGNVIVISQRCKQRGINYSLKKIDISTPGKEINECDILFMGGAQDRQQEIVNNDLLSNKGKYLKKSIEENVPALFICGAYQFLGKYYKTADKKIIEGLSIFDLYTENPESDKKRLIGDIIVKINSSLKIGNNNNGNNNSSTINNKPSFPNYIIGFENHGGRTYLSKNVEPLGTVIKGYGNNGKDKTEGVIYKNAIGTYLHGPLLSKNPEIADFLIQKALFKKNNIITKLNLIDNSFEDKAKEVIVKRYFH